MANLIGISALVVIITIAVGYIIKAKRKGKKCIGCPYAEECSKKNCK